MKTIQLILLRSTILDAVKSETLITSNSDRAADEKATRLAYHEQAGDDEYKERKLQRDMLTAAEELKTFMSDFATQKYLTAADNAVFLDLSDSAAVKYRMEVSDRFNNANKDTLARLGSDFIIKKMLMLWWAPINPKRAADYSEMSEQTLTPILKCFDRTPPLAPKYPYTTAIYVPDAAVKVKKGETAVISYSIDEDATNDIEATSLNLTIMQVAPHNDNSFSVFGRESGMATLQLYSRHDPIVKNLVTIIVEE